MAIDANITLGLPLPWKDKQFKISRLAPVNFLVGPNGSGKSQFASSLLSALPSARLLGTDRLSRMEKSNQLSSYFGDTFAAGLAKSHFDTIKSAGRSGSGLDALILLEERMELRIQVEATLSHLFNRSISLEWDSGHLIAQATLGDGGAPYRLDREECHGIKELLVLLTHLYNDDHQHLIIDEPELNLHPQYQAFFMQEVRKVAGDPEKDTAKKIIFLVTHSPFILDFRSIEDVKATISFGLDHAVPRVLTELDENAERRLSSIIPRLNVHHKQLFFADNPIFVEGVLDAQLIETLQHARGVSIAGAGSCIIDAGGCEEVNRYLELCLAFGKQAHFVYDLDSLYNGNLRACVKGDGEVQNFLATSGVGNDFAKYCGELDGKLTTLIDRLVGASPSPYGLERLIKYLRSLGSRKNWDSKTLARGRVAVLTAISRQRGEMIAALSASEVSEVEGRLSKVVAALAQKNIHLLSGGTLERYLPSYTGDPYKLDDAQKKEAVSSEMAYLAGAVSEAELRNRYGQLYEVIEALPTKSHVDPEPVLRRYLSRYIHDLQAATVAHSQWTLDEFRAHLSSSQKSTGRVFSLKRFDRLADGMFSADIEISEMLGQGRRRVTIDHKTNAGMGEFKIVTV